MERKSREAELTEKRQFWRKQVQDWQESGLSQKEFCRRNDLPEHRLTYWKNRFLKSEAAVSLVQLQVGGDNGLENHFSQGSGLRLIINKKFEIEVDRGFDPHALWQLIYALDRR